MSSETRVLELVRKVLERRKLPTDTLSRDSLLHQGGLQMDSLDTAELSILFKAHFGADPYAKGKVPATVKDLIDFIDEHGKP